MDVTPPPIDRYELRKQPELRSKIHSDTRKRKNVMCNTVPPLLFNKSFFLSFSYTTRTRKQST